MTSTSAIAIALIESNEEDVHYCMKGEDLTYEESTFVHDNIIDESCVPIEDNPFEMVCINSNDDVEINEDVDKGFIFDGRLSEDVDVSSRVFNDDVADDGFDRDMD